jgi:hypothetical protein
MNMTVNLTTSQLKGLKHVADGGEATIYGYKGGRALKIFRSSVNLALKQRKIEELMRLSLPSSVVAPREMAAKNGKFAGYLMPRVLDADEVHQLVKNRTLAALGWTNRDVLGVSVSIGQTLAILRQQGIVLGDLSDRNILFKGNGVYFIDTDSWGLAGLPPDAYTEEFTAPECYGGAPMRLNGASDLFSYAVLCFNILARIHPFNGTLERDPNMSTTERIKQGISVLGKEKIIIPKMISSWNWMSPDLARGFREIFESGQRQDITPLLEDQLQHSKLCKVHGVHYYSRYSECPLCSGAAKLVVAPVAVKVMVSGPVVKVVFEAADMKILFNESAYLATSGEVVHVATGRRIQCQPGQQVSFTVNGQFALVADRECVKIYDASDQLVGRLERFYGTYMQVKGNSLYYIDPSRDLVEVKITPQGNLRRVIMPTSNPLFSVADDGEIFVMNRYPGKALVRCNGRNFELDLGDRIREYAIRRDSVTGKWLFIYQLPSGKYRTVIFGAKAIEYDSDVMSYHAVPLSGICFAGGTIYDPADGKIIGTNVFRDIAKEFACDVVDESSKLQFTNGGFDIVTDTLIYRYA